MPSVSFWAAVPHYVSLAPSPRAALALCDRLSSLLDVPIDVAELEAMVEGYTSHVTEAVSSDEDAVAYVDELEQRADMIEEEDIPSGDSHRGRADAVPARARGGRLAARRRPRAVAAADALVRLGAGRRSALRRVPRRGVGRAVPRRPRICTRCSCWKERRRACRGRRSSTSGRATGGRSPASSRTVVARFGDRDVERLLGRFRHRPQPAEGRVGRSRTRSCVLEVQEADGSLAAYLWSFVGGTPIVGSLPRAARASGGDRRVAGDEQGPQAARVPLRRPDRLLRVHAVDGHGQGPRRRLLPVRRDQPNVKA